MSHFKTILKLSSQASPDGNSTDIRYQVHTPGECRGEICIQVNTDSSTSLFPHPRDFGFGRNDKRCTLSSTDISWSSIRNSKFRIQNSCAMHGIRSFGTMFEPRYIVGAKSLG